MSAIRNPHITRRLARTVTAYAIWKVGCQWVAAGVGQGEG